MERVDVKQYERPELTDLGEFSDETGLFYGLEWENAWPFTLG